MFGSDITGGELVQTVELESYSNLVLHKLMLTWVIEVNSIIK